MRQRIGMEKRKPSAFAYASAFVLTVGVSVLSIVAKGIKVVAKHLVKTTRQPKPTASLKQDQVVISRRTS